MGQRTMTLVVLCIGLFWMGTTGFQTVAPFFEQPPLVYRNQPFPVQGPTYVGGHLDMEIDRCNITDRTFDFDYVRVLVPIEGSQSVFLVSERSIATPDCLRAVTSVDLPDHIRPGWYYMLGIVTVAGRFRQSFKLPYRSEPFEVLPMEVHRDRRPVPAGSL